MHVYNSRHIIYSKHSHPSTLSNPLPTATSSPSLLRSSRATFKLWFDFGFALWLKSDTEFNQGLLMWTWVWHSPVAMLLKIMASSHPAALNCHSPPWLGPSELFPHLWLNVSWFSLAFLVKATVAIVSSWVLQPHRARRTVSHGPSPILSFGSYILPTFSSRSPEGDADLSADTCP